MNWEVAIELAHQRMREIDKKCGEYHIDILPVVGTKEERDNGLISFTAYNEYLYLIDSQNYSGLLILSDTAIYNADDHTHNTKHQEFTGHIQIFKLPGSEWSITDAQDLLIMAAAVPAPEPVTKLNPVNFLRVVIH